MLALLSALLIISCATGTDAADFVAFTPKMCACIDDATLSQVSKSDCVLNCLANPECRTFRYEDSNRMCEHSKSYHGCFSYVLEGSVSYRKSGSTPVNASSCLMQKRESTALSFARSWTDYVSGFSGRGSFWLGLDRIYQMAGGLDSVKLRVQLWLGSAFYQCMYTGFTVKGPADGYAMNYSKYHNLSSISFGDSLLASRGARFATFDSTDNSIGQLCSKAYGDSGWWFGDGENCSLANPNGVFDRSGPIGDRKFVSWFTATGQWEPLYKIVMYLEY